MPVQITSVDPGSIAERHGIHAGDVLHSINGHPIADVLDYRFYLMNSVLHIMLDSDGRKRLLRIRKQEYEDIGLEFETYLMDKKHSCTNKCVFCFVDQLPKGMRESLYFKDDDSRLSFLFGNYITMTNMNDEDVDRICRMHISPINVSVHTTNPELRVRMMGNRFAGDKLRFLPKLAESGITLNTQLVLCPGWNDGPELDRSLRDLSALYPAVQSVALVPVGLTFHREGLCKLEAYTKETAAQVIRQAEAFNRQWMKDGRDRLAYPADEFFLKAEIPVPEAEYYGAFDQLENGVGMLSLMWKEVIEAAEELEPDDRARTITLATGAAASALMKNIVDFLQKKWHNLKCEVVTIVNNFFGPSVTVAGLITGGDLMAQLGGKALGEELLIPAVMLRSEDSICLDDVPLQQIADTLRIPVHPVQNDGGRLVRAILGVSAGDPVALPQEQKA